MSCALQVEDVIVSFVCAKGYEGTLLQLGIAIEDVEHDSSLALGVASMEIQRK